MFSPVKARRIFEEVVEQIREQIVTGRLKPGDKLPAERELAEQLGVSRTAVREALRVLEIAGTVQLRKGVHGGAFIAAADPSVIADSLQDMLHLGRITAGQLTEARIWIETMITRIVCETGTEADFAALEANVAEVERLMAEGRDRERVEANIEFHNVLARATRNPVLILNVAMLMDIMRYFASRLPIGYGEVILASRHRLLRHMRARDADAAVAEMEALLRTISARYETLTPIIKDTPAGQPAAAAPEPPPPSRRRPRSRSRS
ncbi:MAG: FadR/GntR family transcriptional regulator [Reyranellaceae bacterium]